MATLALETAAQAFLVLELFGFPHALNLVAPLSDTFMIEGSVKFIGLAFAFVTLQAGVAEGSYAVIFGAIGLPAAAGFSLLRSLDGSGRSLWPESGCLRSRG